MKEQRFLGVQTKQPALIFSKRDGCKTPQQYVDRTLDAVEQTMGHASRYKAEVSYNMWTNPPTPMMEKDALEALTTEKIPWTDGGRAHMGNRLKKDHGISLTGKTRRPDVIVVNDPESPPTQDNIFRVVEMKFKNEMPNDEQMENYAVIAGSKRKTILMNQGYCHCGDAQETQEQVSLVLAAKAVNDAHVSWGERALYGTGAVVTGIATGIALASLVDGPAGEIALGSLTASLSARAVASGALSLVERQALVRSAAAVWATLFSKTNPIGM